MKTKSDLLLDNNEAQELLDKVYKYFLLGSLMFGIACGVVVYLASS